MKRTLEWRAAYGKPVVNDEPEYEGNIAEAWGNISAQELVHRFWTTTLRGGYAGHGETYRHPEDLIWWAKGGELHGQAWQRIGFLRAILEEDIQTGFEPIESGMRFAGRVSAARDGDTTIIYLGEHQPEIWAYGLPKADGEYEVDVIDTWAMQVMPAERVPALGNHPVRHGAVTLAPEPDAAFAVKLPSQPNLAIRIRPARS